jgi:hypothetical protein
MKQITTKSNENKYDLSIYKNSSDIFKEKSVQEK